MFKNNIKISICWQMLKPGLIREVTVSASIKVSGTSAGSEVEFTGLDLASETTLSEVRTGIENLISKMSAGSSLNLHGASQDFVKALDQAKTSADAFGTLMQNQANSLGQVLGSLSQNLVGLNTATTDLSTGFAGLNMMSVQASQSLGGISAAAGGLVSGVKNLSSAVGNTAKDLDKFSSVLVKSQNQSGGSDSSPDSGSGDTLDSLASAANTASLAGGPKVQAAVQVATRALEGFRKALDFAKKAMDVVVGSVLRIAEVAVDFTSLLMHGSGKLSEFTEFLGSVVKQLPVVGGLLSNIIGLFTSYVSYMEELNSINAELSQNGANFSSNLLSMEQITRTAGVGLRDFARAVSNSSEQLAIFGTVRQGAQRLAEITRTARGQLMNLGLTIEDVVEELPGILSVLALGSDKSAASNQVLAQSAVAVVTELDMLAQLTGKSRRQQQEELQRQTQDAAFKMKLASMDENQRAQIMQAMSRFQGIYGEAGADIVRAQVLGIVPLSQGARMLQATIPPAVDGMRNLVDGVMNSSAGMDNFNQALDDSTVDIVKQGMASSQNLKTVLQAAAVGMGGSATEINSVFNELYKNSASFLDKNGQLDEKRFRQTLAQIRQDQANTDAAKKSMDTYTKAMLDIKEMLFNKVGKPIMDRLAPVLPVLTARITELANKFMAFLDSSGFFPWFTEKMESLPVTVGKVFDWFTGVLFPAMKTLAGWISNYVLPALDSLGKWISNSLVPAIRSVAQWINGKLIPVIQRISEAVMPYLVAGMEKLQEIITFVSENFSSFMIALGLVLSPLVALAAIVTALGAAIATITTVVIAGFIAQVLQLTKGIQLFRELLPKVLEDISHGFQSLMLSFKEIMFDLKKFFGFGSAEEKQQLQEERKQLTEARAATLEKRDQDRTEREANEKRQQTAAAEKRQQDQESQQKTAGFYQSLLQMFRKTESAADATAPASDNIVASLTRLNQTQKSNIELIKQALAERGITSQGQIAAVLGNVGKESGFQTVVENLDYSRTSNQRIREIFGSRVANLSEEQLTALKSDQEKFANRMYGVDTRQGQSMGNTEPGDGWKFRGRGFIQLTGKNNYAAASNAIFQDDRLVNNPDLALEPDVAAEITAWFVQKQGASMAQRMGVDLAKASQEQLNRVYTSAIAGRQITAGQGYLGAELLGKVDAYAQMFTGAAPVTGDRPALGKASNELLFTPAAQTATAAPAAQTATAAPAARPAVQSTKDDRVVELLANLVDLNQRANRLLQTIAQEV